MISTSDNPYNPWTQYDDWYAWDESNGYHTCSYVARCMGSPLSSITDLELDSLYNLATQEIIKTNITGNYILVPEQV